MKSFFTYTKPDFKFVIQFFVIWVYLNTAFNIWGLWIIKQISGTEFQPLQNVFVEFFKPIIIQSVVFGVCFLIAITFLRSRKLSIYLFSVVQFIVFNFIFLINLKTTGGIHFETTWNNFGLHYLSYNGQYMIDILQTLFPMSGEFEGEIFKPTETLKFYFYWIILINLYFASISLISQAVYRFIRTNPIGNENLQTVQ